MLCDHGCSATTYCDPRRAESARNRLQEISRCCDKVVAYTICYKDVGVRPHPSLLVPSGSKS
jgi:hypothetical protein